MLGLLGLRIFEACGANIGDLGEEHGHRVLSVTGKGGKVVLSPMPPAVPRVIDRAVDGRQSGPVLDTSVAPGWTGTAPPAACASLAEAGGVHAARMHFGIASSRTGKGVPPSLPRKKSATAFS